MENYKEAYLLLFNRISDIATEMQESLIYQRFLIELRQAQLDAENVVIEEA